MTYLDPDPLYIADDEEPWVWVGKGACPPGRHMHNDYHWGSDRPSPSLTVPLVLLCAVLTVLVAVWWVKG